MLALVLGGCLSAPSPLRPNLFVAEDPSDCKALNPSATDEWCVSTCATSCPESICSCASAAIPYPGAGQEALIPAGAEIIPATAPSQPLPQNSAAAGAPSLPPLPAPEAAPEPAPVAAEPAPLVAAAEPAPVAATEPAQVSPDPAATDFDASSCKTIGAATDEWCVATCSALDCPESNGLCKCGPDAAEDAATATATESPAAAAPAAAAPAAAAAAEAAPSPGAWTGTTPEHNNADWWNYEAGANRTREHRPCGWRSHAARSSKFGLAASFLLALRLQSRCRRTRRRGIQYMGGKSPTRGFVSLVHSVHCLY